MSASAPITVRHAIPDDLPEIYRMARAFHAASNHAEHTTLDVESVGATLRDLIVNQTGVALVAERGGAICGMAAALAIPLWMNRAQIVGQELFWWVDEDARGSRAAIKMLRGLEAWARAMGCASFSMATTTNLTPERIGRFYERLGYVPQDIFYRRVF